MEKEFTNEPHLIDILISKGYEKEFAKKCLQDVLDARREARETSMKTYIGKRGK